MHRRQAPSFIFISSFFFFWLSFFKLLIGVPSGNHDVLAARSDLTQQMERFLNFVHLSQVSVGGADEQRLEGGADQLVKLVDASVGFIQAGHSHLRPLFHHVNRFEESCWCEDWC